MRKTIATVLVLAIATSTAFAKPHKARGQSAKARKAAEAAFVLQCIDERTGPVGGLELDDAEQLCKSIVKHQHKITRLAKLAADARKAGIARLTQRAEHDCAEEVSVACEDTTVRDHDDGTCSDAVLESKHAFDVCRGKAFIDGEAEGK